MSGQIERWADKAMFQSEPLVAADGPQVHLLSMSADPLGEIAAAALMYEGKTITDLAQVTEEQRSHYLAQMLKTKLQAPLEFVKFHFVISNVTRSFTHQMVRQRTAAYAQESMRFAVVEGPDLIERVALPPSLASIQDDDEPWARASEKKRQLRRWQHAVAEIGSAYETLVNSGVPAEEARGLLPHNVTTRLHYTTDLRALMDHAGNRLCTQAQFEWREVFSKIAGAIKAVSIGIDHGWIDGVPQGHDSANGRTRVWRSREISRLFRPVCYATGKCEFQAASDRSCTIRARVTANSEIGRTAERWQETYATPEVRPGLDTDEHVIRNNDSNVPQYIGAIYPQEWLHNDAAARVK